MADTLIQLDSTRKMSVKCLLILSVEMSFISDGFADGKINKLVKMAGVMHQADHVYSIRSTWCLHQLAIDVSFIACVIKLPRIFFTHYLELSNF